MNVSNPLTNLLDELSTLCLCQSELSTGHFFKELSTGEDLSDDDGLRLALEYFEDADDSVMLKSLQDVYFCPHFVPDFLLASSVKIFMNNF